MIFTDDDPDTENSLSILNQLSKKDTFVVHVENQLSNTDTLNVRSIKAKSGTNSGNIVH